MKNAVLMIVGVFLFSCSVEEDFSEEQSSGNLNLNGTWKLVQSSYSIGDATQRWQSVENGYYYKFNNDGSFVSDRIQNCDGGTFNVGDETITLNFSCDGVNTEYVEKAVMQNGFLFLSPVKPYACIEGCSYKFIKQ